MPYEPHVFESLGMGYIQNRPPTFQVVADDERTLTNAARFRAFFGISPAICTDIWNLLRPEENMRRGAMHFHLLWAFAFLKIYATEVVLASLFHCDEKTFRKWSKIFVVAVSWLEPFVVSAAGSVVDAQIVTFPTNVFATDPFGR